MPLGLKERGAHHCQGTPMLCCKGHEKWTGGWRRICCREDFHFKVGDVAASVVEWSGSKGNDDRPRAGRPAGAPGAGERGGPSTHPRGRCRERAAVGAPQGIR